MKSFVLFKAVSWSNLEKPGLLSGPKAEKHEGAKSQNSEELSLFKLDPFNLTLAPTGTKTDSVAVRQQWY